MLKVIARKLFQHANVRTVAPPAIPIANGKHLPNIVVASKMRSGTHLAIDSILNNFSDYRRKPLYIDIDEYAKQGKSIKDFNALGGYIIKTHYPQVLRDMPEGFETLLDQAIIVTPERSNTEIKRSMEYFYEIDSDEVDAGIERFDDYWQDRGSLSVHYKSFRDPQKLTAFLQQIAERTNAKMAAKTTMLPSLGNPKRLFLNKLLTRLLGRHAPIVITSISAGVTPSKNQITHNNTTQAQT